MSIIFLILAETIGLWFVNTKLDIPMDRMVAANWAYQSAIISTALSITQVPYNASITSHEHFGIFAALDITNSVLKLAIALAVLYSSCDHLIEYSLLYTAVAISIMLCYRLYCIRKFKECHISLNFSKHLFKEMISFTGWNLLGNSSFTVYQQGTNVFLNWSFGTFINAAVGIALQVQGILYGFIGNITSAFTPQVVKSYAQKDFVRVNELIFMGARISAILTMLISVPVMVKMDFLMGLWLTDVPEGAVVICQLLLVNNIFNSLNPIVYSGIMASGKLKKINILLGISYFFMLGLVYVILKFTHSYVCVYACCISLPILTGQCYFSILRSYMVEFERWRFTIKVVVPTAIIATLAYVISSRVGSLIESQILSLLVVLAISSVLILFLGYALIFDRKTRLYLRDKVCSFRKNV